jgi:dolichol-phosphate mannosyltransferase
LSLLSIIIPTYNEETNLEELYTRLLNVSTEILHDCEFIFVDDGSIDKSFQLIVHFANQDNRVKYIRFTRNFGHQIAIQAGLEVSKGDLVVIMDSDLQNPPEIIPQLINTLLNGPWQVVHGKRISRKNESKGKKLTASLFYKLFNSLSDTNIPLDTGDFRIMTKKVVQNINQMEEPNKFLRGQISWLGHLQTTLEYESSDRKSGKSSYTYRKMINLAANGITGFSDFPLKFATYSGLIVSMISFLLIIYVLVSKYILHLTVSGWTSIMTAILFIGGIQLLSIGIIGEYISRINDSTRKRPLYIINESNIA